MNTIPSRCDFTLHQRAWPSRRTQSVTANHEPPNRGTTRCADQAVMSIAHHDRYPSVAAHRGRAAQITCCYRHLRRDVIRKAAATNETLQRDSDIRDCVLVADHHRKFDRLERRRQPVAGSRRGDPSILGCVQQDPFAVPRRLADSLRELIRARVGPGASRARALRESRSK